MACVEKYGYMDPCAPVLENANFKAAMTFFMVFLLAIITNVAQLSFLANNRACSHMQ